MRKVIVEPLTPASFAPFGDVLEAVGAADILINDGYCERFHDRAQLDFGEGGRAGISIFRAKPRDLPYQLEMLERHPEGSQAFIPMSMDRFLIIVAEDGGGAPVNIRAFITTAGQGINFHRGIWHGVLTPLSEPGLFAVVDRIGTTANLEEHKLAAPLLIQDITD